MQRSNRLPLAHLLIGAWAILAIGARAEPRDAVPPDARAVLGRALDLRYDIDSTERVHIVMRNRFGEERRRSLAVATKRIDGRMHSLGRFLEPDYLRGTSILTIENDDRSDDHFLFLKTLSRVRRVTTAQRTDAFMGTDLTYEDFERRRIEDYDAAFLPDASVAGEPVRVVEGRPRFDSAYERVAFSIATRDAAILETRYYKRDSDEPYKVIHTPRAEMKVIGGHALPTRLTVENRTRGTRTEVSVEDIRVNPLLDDQLFTSVALEVGRKIPGVEAPALEDR